MTGRQRRACRARQRDAEADAREHDAAKIGPPELLQLIASGNQAAHEFKSADQFWTVTLHRDFLALSTSAYTRWSHFRAQRSLRAR